MKDNILMILKNTDYSLSFYVLIYLFHLTKNNFFSLFICLFCNVEERNVDVAGKIFI